MVHRRELSMANGAGEVWNHVARAPLMLDGGSAGCVAL